MKYVIRIERESGYDLLHGTLWTGLICYVHDGEEYEAGIDAALEITQQNWGGIEGWLDQFFPHDERLRITVTEAAPGREPKPVYEDVFMPREEWASVCACCGSGLNTLTPCPECGELLCQDCMPVHICDPQ